MFIIYRRTPCLLNTTIFARNFSAEGNVHKNNDDQLKGSAINLLTNELKSAKIEINSKIDLFNTQMKTEIVNIKREIKDELDINKNTINNEIDKLKEENSSVKNDLRKIQFYWKGLIWILGGGICSFFIYLSVIPFLKL